MEKLNVVSSLGLKAVEDIAAARRLELILVCGDPHRNRVMVMEGGHAQPTTRVIRG